MQYGSIDHGHAHEETLCLSMERVINIHTNDMRKHTIHSPNAENKKGREMYANLNQCTEKRSYIAIHGMSINQPKTRFMCYFMIDR